MIAVTNGAKTGFRPPPRASAIGLWLVLASLSMLFISSMLMYVLMRLHVIPESVCLECADISRRLGSVRS